MTRIVLADTGPLYAALDPADQYHQRAQTGLMRLANEKVEVAIAYPILFESYLLLLYCLGQQTESTWLVEAMHGANFLNPTPEDYRDLADRLRAFADRRITLFDAIVAVLARRLALQVWTYDHHFDEIRVPIWR